MKKGIDYVGIGIGAVIFNNQGKALLSKRGKNAQNEKGKWSYPGGDLKFGETFEQCVSRETKEEFGIKVKPVEQLETFNHLLPKEKQHWVAVAFICKLLRGKPIIQERDKEIEVGWFTIKETEKLSLTKVAKHRLKQLKQRFPKLNLMSRPPYMQNS